MRIISGGQTGADRGGLDAAIALGLLHGGYCPAGRRAEDGRIPDVYVMTEHPSRDYPPRTRLNIAAADATLVFTYGKPRRGSALTCTLARELAKPYRWINLDDLEKARQDLASFLAGHPIEILNIAGSRESSHPGIQATVRDLLIEVARSMRWTQA